jgi:dihydroneopterin aldolase
MPIDKVFVRSCKLDAFIGLEPWEHQTRQRIEVDLEADVDTTELLSSGDLSKGLDYAKAAQRIREIALNGHIELVECLADKIAKEILASSAALRVAVEVRKYCSCVGLADHVGVRVVRDRTSNP